jgi:hypothetical protein
VSLTDVSRNDPERHRSFGGAFPEAYESHCLNAGRFTLTLSENSAPAFVRPLDFVSYVNAGSRFIEDASTDPHGAASMDVLVDVAEGSGNAATPGLAMSATLNPGDANWPVLALQQGAYRVPSNFWIRLNAGSSVPASGVQPQQLLVRYFWNWPNDLLDRNGFANAVSTAGSSLIRVKQLSSGARTVRMHLVQPYERPANPTDVSATDYGAVLDIPFNVYGPLTATISPNPATILARSPLQFTGGGSNGAGSNTYLWAFGDGSTSTAANPSHSYDVPGQKTVTFTKTDLYGFSFATNGSVTVTDPPPTNLSASNVAATTATVSWLNGNPGTTTTIQDRATGTQNWTTAGTAAAGVTTLGLTNLTACTTYDVNAYHVTAATMALSLFRTAGGGLACAPLSFTLVSCIDKTINGVPMRSYNVSWVQGEFSNGSTYEIGKTNTSDPSGATIISSGPSSTTWALLGPYSRNVSQVLYMWVRHKLSGGSGASAWVPLDNQPMNPNGACF